MSDVGKGSQPTRTAKHRKTAARIVKYDVHCRQTAAVNAFQQTDDDFWAKVSGVSRFFCGECGREVLPKVQEWWAVSDWLGDRLSRLGEAVYNGDDAMIWGRTTTGLALEADEIVAKIAAQVHGDR